MSKWQAIQIEYLADSWWIVEEVNDHGQGGRRIIYCGDDEALAHRIARLPELEAKVKDLQTLIAYAHQQLTEAPEINMSNYTSDEVDELNKAVNDVCCELEKEAAEAVEKEAAGKECCPGCGADVEESPREDGYTRWACGSNTGAWGFGRSQACWERREAAKAAGKKENP